MQTYDLLIVDDEEIIRSGLARTVDWEALGFRVAGTAVNGEKALDFISTQHVDAVLADIRMPKLTGLELARRLRESHPEIRVVILSGFDTFRFAQEAIDYGVFSYLLKPSKTDDIKEVFTRLRHSLDADRAPVPAPVSEQDFSRDEADQSAHRRSIALALRHIAENYAQDLSLDSVASCLSISPAYFCRLFKKEMGVNFKDYLTNLRIERAKTGLRDPRLKVYEVAEAVGFRDQRYFSEIFKKRTGLSPLEYRDGQG